MISQVMSNEATSSEVMESGEKEKKEFQKQKKEIKVIKKSEMGYVNYCGVNQIKLSRNKRKL